MRITWKQTWQWLLVIVVLGLGLRLYGIGTNSFVADEFLDINSSYGYFQTGTWKAWDFNFGVPAVMNENDARDERAFVYKWQVATLFHFVSPTEGHARLVSVAWGVISIFAMFWAGYFYTRKKSIGLIAAILFAVSISAIIFDRRLRMYAMFFPVYLALATMLFALFEREYEGGIAWLRRVWERYGLNITYALPLLALVILGALVHGLSLSAIPVFGVYALVMMVRTWREEGRLMTKYGVVVLLGILGAIGAILFAPQLVRLALGSVVFFDDHYSYFGYILRDFAHPLLGALLILYGIRVTWKRLGLTREALWLALSLLVPLAMAVWLWRRNAGPQYIFFVQSFALILTSIGVYGLAKLVKERFSEWGQRGLLGVFLLSMLLLPNWGYFLEENNTYHETSSGDNPNYRKVFDYVKKNKSNEDVIITRNFRNYYLSGAKMPVYDFGGELSESKFSLVELETIAGKHPHGWVVLSTNDYDYISRDAELYIKKRMELVSNAQVRGAIEVYRW
jgi:hypothetical protein